jgi:diguanylate cyclase (GGDEF)-like protein
MTDERGKRLTPRPGRLTIVPITSWTLWQRSRLVVFYVLAIETTVVLLAVGALHVWAVTPTDLTRAVVIWGCATVYIEVTRPIERIRELTSPTQHTDLNAIWTFSAALLVHPALVAVIVSANYLHRWLRVRHHVVHRQTFSAAATVLGSYAAIGVLIATHQHPAMSSGARDVAACLAIAAAALTYLVVSTSLVSGAIALTTPRLSFLRVATDPEDAALELAGIGLGVLFAWALLDWPAILAVIFGIAVVLHGKVLVRQLRAAVRTDPKTGLLNMPAWTNAARLRMVRADVGRQIGLLMIDLDHFKLVNDVYGHLLGDEVLIAVAMAITDEVRSGDVVGRTDLVGRFGGEEFVILLWDSTETTTVAIAERIRNRIGTIPVITPSPNGSTDTMIRVTCSVGAAVYPHHGSSLDTLLQAADQALHNAKQSGRNQVHLARLS